jgi:hypothetical protein
MYKRSLTMFVVALLLAGARAANADPTTAPVHTPFVSVLLPDFDAWDTNHDGGRSQLMRGSSRDCFRR